MSLIKAKGASRAVPEEMGGGEGSQAAAPSVFLHLLLLLLVLYSCAISAPATSAPCFLSITCILQWALVDLLACSADRSVSVNDCGCGPTLERKHHVVHFFCGGRRRTLQITKYERAAFCSFWLNLGNTRDVLAKWQRKGNVKTF